MWVIVAGLWGPRGAGRRRSFELLRVNPKVSPTELRPSAFKTGAPLNFETAHAQIGDLRTFRNAPSIYPCAVPEAASLCYDTLPKMIPVHPHFFHTVGFGSLLVCGPICSSDGSTFHASRHPIVFCQSKKFKQFPSAPAKRFEFYKGPTPSIAIRGGKLEIFFDQAVLCRYCWDSSLEPVEHLLGAKDRHLKATFTQKRQVSAPRKTRGIW